MLNNRMHIPLFMLICMLSLMIGTVPITFIFIPDELLNIKGLIIFNVIGWTIIAILSFIKIIKIQKK